MDIHSAGLAKEAEYEFQPEKKMSEERANDDSKVLPRKRPTIIRPKSMSMAGALSMPNIAQAADDTPINPTKPPPPRPQNRLSLCVKEDPGLSSEARENEKNESLINTGNLHQAAALAQLMTGRDRSPPPASIFRPPEDPEDEVEQPFALGEPSGESSVDRVPPARPKAPPPSRPSQGPRSTPSRETAAPREPEVTQPQTHPQETEAQSVVMRY